MNTAVVARAPHQSSSDDGLVPAEFNRETKLQLISVSLEELIAACDANGNVDWGSYSAKIIKVRNFLRASGWNLPAGDVRENY